MKRIFIATIFFLSLFLSVFAAPGELISNPTVPTTKNSITLIYEPSVSQNWMKTQDVFIYVCLEMDQNGEWVKEKAEWSKSDLPNFKWVKGADGKLTYTISNIKTYFNLTDADMSRVSGLFVILKNDKYQTTDKYIRIESKEGKQEKFQGTVSFNVTVPEGTKQVYVAGTFAEQGSPLYWKHADEKLKLTQKDGHSVIPNRQIFSEQWKMLPAKIWIGFGEVGFTESILAIFRLIKLPLLLLI